MEGPLMTSFPASLTFDVCKVLSPGAPCVWDDWDGETVYVCPGTGRDVSENYRCGGPEYGYCYHWGCETTGSVYWNPSSTWDLIKVSKVQSGSQSSCRNNEGGRCNFHQLQFTEKGKQGLFLYRKTTYDPFGLFMLKREIATISPSPIGPNRILTGLLGSDPPSGTQIPGAMTPVTPVGAHPSHPNHTSGASSRARAGDRLLNLVLGAHSALNQTAPERAKSCWLCLAAAPPYYEGIATLGNYSKVTVSEPRCHAGTPHPLTLAEVSGSGLCLGKPPQTHTHLCNKTIDFPQEQGSYLLPQPGAWWACNGGLTPCLSPDVLNGTGGFCIMIKLLPRIFYHPAGEVERSFTQRPHWAKREPVSLTLALLLGAGVAAGVGTGTAALVQGPQLYANLEKAISEDIRDLEQSVSYLQESLSSLAEVVLQNRRGLDLLFLKEGGMCVALGEECCFYADNSGVVKDSMAKLRQRLDARQKEREASQPWFERWFNNSPWLTTLVSTLLGPLFIILLLLTLGPCILNRILQFVRDRLSVVQTLVLKNQYQMLNTADSEIP
ncbi:MLV-related proviral Env polyprotein-like [Nannospalax galili]|uniref:MLV-related proviral Env polyprotein-like n=1 Tax=Nannospalax galili TaxID=1026970 RepID=UPI0004ED513D|nr:MLV-related proviral Env polyprotein-like [Nannospalax galili]